MVSESYVGKDRILRLIPLSILAVLIAGGLLLTSAAITTSWGVMHGGDHGLNDCSAQHRNYHELHRQVVELAGLFPALKDVLPSDLAPPPHGHHRATLRRMVLLDAQEPSVSTPAPALAPQPQLAAGPSSDPAAGANGPHPQPHHPHRPRHEYGSHRECIAAVSDLHARVYYALRLVTREARQTQDKMQEVAVRADQLQSEVFRLNHAAAAAANAANPPAVPGPSPAWDAGKVGLDTGVVVGTPVRFQGQEQHMVVPVNDQYVGGMMRQSQTPFQADRLALMLVFVRVNSTVLDVGGNLGAYAIWFARAVGPRGQVYTFEAQSFIYQVLTTNLLINGHRNVHALHTAVSFKRGVTHMGERLLDGDTGGKNYSEVTAHKLDQPVNYGGRTLGEGGEEVPMITIDSLNLTGVSFIKLDIQGSEPLAVYGAQRTITANKPVVQFENEAYLFNISAAMIRDMAIPPKVLNFSIQGFLRSLDYRIVIAVDFDEFWVPPGYEHPEYGWEKGALSRDHLSRGLRGGQDFVPNPQPTPPTAAAEAPTAGGGQLGQGVEGTALPLHVPAAQAVVAMAQAAQGAPAA